MQLIIELRKNSRKEHWREGFVWLAWSLIGGLFPVWLTIVGLLLTKQHIKASVFTDNAEFALYSASYVAGTLYLLFRDLSAKAFPSRAILGLLFCTLLLIAAAVFMVVALLGVIGSTGKPDILILLDREVLRQLSMIVFGVSMLFSLLVIVADNMRTMPDLEMMAERDFADLNKKFDGLEGGSK